MRILGIIAEYNPFHMGHLYHLNKSKEIVKPDYTIAIMSGHFTQRGEPTITDKWARTKMVLLNGVDMVIELPTAFACQTAEIFAEGSIDLLNKIGIVSHVSFGSENGEISTLKTIADVALNEPTLYKHILKKELGNGESYAKARSNAILGYLKYKNLHSNLETIKSSNNILAIEYLKALTKTNSSISPFTITRLGSDYNSTQLAGRFSSASAIREFLYDNNDFKSIKNSVPLYSYNILKEHVNKELCPINLDHYCYLITELINRSTLNELNTIYDVNEGLNNRIKKSINNTYTLEEIINNIKSKRYTYSKISRILAHIALNIQKNHMMKFRKSGPNYIRVLGVKSSSKKLLKFLNEKSKVPVLINMSKYIDQKLSYPDMLNLDIFATNTYSFLINNKSERNSGKDYTKGLVIV